ncbi:Thiol-disulfide oxidoreductase YkuV [Caulifigura coniformis]|uniref:Thiol-disulfide oxidoreductase YkuV n=1 Tax=Caulifigura coniformis TaxID=2527983 RepID=A0A517SD38_9PLAN|nr:redoxin domain-containing protein [Caulifigura coniformis]QDT54027.1 Thiol-disulfide oxidoreductase YkuV [Caulifigura coniformis]
MRLPCCTFAAVLLVALAGPVFSDEPDPRIEAFWVLLHEPAVVEELKLSAEQQSRFTTMRDGWDLRFFPLRNQKPEVSRPTFAALVAEAREELKEVLDERQETRLREVELRRLGTDSFLQPEMEPVLKLTDSQKEKIRAIVSETRESLQRAAAKAKEEKTPQKQLEGRLRTLKIGEQRKVLDRLTQAQRDGWTRMLGEAFDVTRLGRPAFRVPDLIDSGQWANSEGLASSSLRGKVVAVHFYAFGCINCIHNYPAYLDWQSRYRGQDLVIVGIHTPETKAERDIEAVKRKAAEEKFEFPVLIDVDSKNWDAWGNSMWPSVYLVDKAGRLRFYWTGELNWQGQTGEAQMRKHIEELLTEPAP